MLYELGLKGFEGIGVETSAAARKVAESILEDFKSIQIQDQIPPDSEAFDYLLSFEVLEHIENDHAALKEWASRLRPGGTCLLSVPAHRSRWNLTDVLAGHYRRYEKGEVQKLVSGAGLEIDLLFTCGWPATWLIEKLRYWVKLKQLRKQGIDAAEIRIGDAALTAESGVNRSVEAKLYPYYSTAVGRQTFLMLSKLQRLFYRSERGVSFVVEAHKLR